jgi:hypothetical protein
MSSVTKRHIYAKAKRKSLISRSLNTPEGRKALAQSMVEPIRKSLEYKAVGRNILFLKEFANKGGL